MSYAGLLTQTCTIKRKTNTKDQYGIVSTGTWNTIASGVRCRIDYMFATNPFISFLPEGYVSGNDYVAYFLAGQDIVKGDLIIRDGDNLELFARIPNNVYARTSAVHHIEVPCGLRET